MANYTQVERKGLYELTSYARSELAASKYYNTDLEPTSLTQRTWTTYNIAALWIGMAICIPSLSLAAALISLGISPWLSVLNVTLGNLIVLIPMQLNSHAGTKYGIPFPAFARLTFGITGAQIPAILRGLVACGWTSVQSWVGGGAVAALLGTFIPFMVNRSKTVAMPGNDAVVVGQLIGFLIFIAFVGWVAYNGIEKIKWVQNIGSPLLIFVILALFAWSISNVKQAGYGFSDVMAQGNDWGIIDAHGGFAFNYMAGLTANIAFWATLALNIPDFSRYAKAQKVQFLGQLYGMPLPMFACAYIGAFFAQSTKLSMGEPIFDPTNVFYYVENKLIVVIASVGVIAATITTCVAANVVAPANGFSNISPQKISYKKGVVITCIIAIGAQPWWIFGSGAAYVFTWLNNYGTILAPLAAIFIADYYVAKQKRIDVAALYMGSNGRYWYKGGWNIAGVIAWIAAFIIPLAGNTVMKYDPANGAPNFLDYLAANGYIVSFAIGFFVYLALMKTSLAGNSFLSEEEHEALTDRATA